jgi:hypothetical protein
MNLAFARAAELKDILASANESQPKKTALVSVCAHVVTQ